MDVPQDHPLKPIVTAWLARMKSAIAHKKKVFDAQAQEAMQFFNGPHAFMFEPMYANAKHTGYLPEMAGADDDTEMVGNPTFRMQVNKVSEMRDLFGPALYAQNPNVQVNPMKPPDPPPQAMGIFQPPPNPQGPMMTPAGPMPPPPTPQELQYQFAMQQYGQLMQQQNDRSVVKGYVAKLLEYALNYVQREMDKKTQARMAIDEAIIKGMGLLWVELEEREGLRSKLITSNYETVDNLLIDPDARDWPGVKWIARRCVHPVWEVEEEYGLPKGMLKDKGQDETLQNAEALASSEEYTSEKQKGKTNDLLTYWKVFTKMGFGDKLKASQANPIGDKLEGAFDELGPYCYLVVAEGVPYPLNIPQDIIDGMQKQEDAEESELITSPMDSEEPEDDKLKLPKTPIVDPQTGQPQLDQTGQLAMEVDPRLFLSVQWPIPFWADGGWPFTPFVFDTVPNQVWPRSWVKKAIGYLRFINWVFSFLATKTRHACITTIGVDKAAGEKIKQQLLNGKDFNVVEIEEALGKSIDEIVKFLQYPEFNGEIWKMLEAVMTEFNKAVGLNEVLYAESRTQDRSAEESSIKQQHAMTRLDDMASRTEDSLSKDAAREAMAMRWLWGPEDVLPILGQVGAQAWGEYVQSSDIEMVVREFDYRIEAGSARKPNKDTRVAQMNQAGQMWGPFLENWAMKTGDVGPANAFIQEWADANDVQMPMLQPPPPPPQPAPPQGPKPPTNRMNGHGKPPIPQAA